MQIAKESRMSSTLILPYSYFLLAIIWDDKSDLRC